MPIVQQEHRVINSQALVKGIYSSTSYFLMGFKFLESKELSVAF